MCCRVARCVNVRLSYQEFLRDTDSGHYNCVDNREELSTHRIP
jgi:hypothetical protein